jgi:hypothetical protein
LKILKILKILLGVLAGPGLSPGRGTRGAIPPPVALGKKQFEMIKLPFFITKTIY